MQVYVFTEILASGLNKAKNGIKNEGLGQKI
jgi:hypothetical protein